MRDCGILLVGLAVINIVGWERLRQARVRIREQEEGIRRLIALEYHERDMGEKPTVKAKPE